MSGETAVIEVQREIGGLSDHLRSYEVVVDGDAVGRLRPGDSATFDIAEGSHEIFLKIDWCRSEKIDFRVGGGETMRFRCSNRANVLTGFYWVTFGRHRYIELTRVT